MKLIIVRHGETFANINNGIMQGQLDSELTPHGVEQSKAVAKFLKDRKIDKIYSSDLIRAKTTADEINKFHKLDVIYSKELRERSFGIFEGKSKEDFRKAFEKAGVDFSEFQPEGGESPRQVDNRIIPFVQEIIDSNKDKTVLVVIHGGVIMEVYFHFLRILKEEFEKHLPINCGVTTLEISEGGDIEVLEMNTNPLPDDMITYKEDGYL